MSSGHLDSTHKFNQLVAEAEKLIREVLLFQPLLKDYELLIDVLKNNTIPESDRIRLLGEILVNFKKEVEKVTPGTLREVRTQEFNLIQSNLIKISLATPQHAEAIDVLLSEKINSKNMRALLAFAAIQDPNSIDKYLNKFYAQPDFENWMLQRPNDLKKIIALEKRIIAFKANYLTEECKKIIAAYPAEIVPEDRDNIEYVHARRLATEHVNRIVYGLKEEIEQASSPEARKQIIMRWIHIAVACRNNNNYHTLMALNTVFQNHQAIVILLSEPFKRVVNNLRDLCKYEREVIPDAMNAEMLAKMNSVDPDGKPTTLIPFLGILGLYKPNYIKKAQEEGKEKTPIVKILEIYISMCKTIRGEAQKEQKDETPSPLAAYSLLKPTNISPIEQTQTPAVPNKSPTTPKSGTT